MEKGQYLLYVKLSSPFKRVLIKTFMVTSLHIISLKNDINIERQRREHTHKILIIMIAHRIGPYFK